MILSPSSSANQFTCHFLRKDFSITEVYCEAPPHIVVVFLHLYLYFTVLSIFVVVYINFKWRKKEYFLKIGGSNRKYFGKTVWFSENINCKTQLWTSIKSIMFEIRTWKILKVKKNKYINTKQNNDTVAILIVVKVHFKQNCITKGQRNIL